ncbi:sulfide/dihydroorotate dehydrogenase-like FAD/NAD-binding protein [Clostridium tarantellae]|uniref:Sulfide/dihydroorotate dehydrogenase-like FAD/NAD-binding protein n=1 Tax=Clostridium tarantellae TaxID=39493 RepID=A0A6I1MPA7_9CLOT|nr:sulfide/dihydroorotate dehydrogenase-like FAD/NAD-binding protein [Clostridium tarantellae]MPQ44623.1 sulfide/dihydroorotate dehydrogenase-like FAD/NAD-binding protein [Clostridium tarantellae]
MKYEIIDCMDAGTEFCPCHLAEEGECILCSQLQGKCFCDCVNWKGVCIYQEFKYNNEKAKPGRLTFTCEVTKAKEVEDNLLFIEFKCPHKLCLDLVAPGSFLFIRTKDNPYFDVPISIMDADTDKNLIKLMIEIRGIKTKRLLNIVPGGEITIRGPYFNGVFGTKNIYSAINDNVLLIVRGIGVAPVLPIIKKLLHQGNNLKVLVDKTPFSKNYLKEYLDKNSIEYLELNLINKGLISFDAKDYIINDIKTRNTKLIHCAGADILTYKLIEFLDSLGKNNIKISCCNNAKMCCGEGVCGSCTARFAGHKVKRLCKIQTDPRNIFEGRRFI